MVSISALFIAAATALVGSAAANEAAASKLPVFFFHGATGNKTNGAEIEANLKAEGRTYVALDFCQNACSVRTALSDQVQMAIKQIRGIIAQSPATYANGYHFLAHSQGGSVSRGVVEEMDDHKVHSYISMAGDGNGNFFGPQASDAVPLQVLLQALGPFAIDKADFDFSKYAADSTSWNGKFQSDLIQTVTTNKALQAKSSIANIIAPPLADAALTNWLNIDPFLPKVNNLQNCGSDAKCKADQARRKANFLKLKAAHFFASPQDDIQAPWQSCLLGKYSTVASVAEVNSKFSSFKIIDMKQTAEYTKDLYGLKTLDTSGRLHMHQVPNVPHNCWLFDYTSLATKVPCKHDPVYKAQIYPVLVVADRLKATEDALRAAQATIARQEKREQELRRLVVSHGIAQDATEANPALEAKVGALKAVHEKKVRVLMKSINQLQEQLQGLKAQEKEHRRSALIQDLRKQQREQELLIDVLKQTLQEKIPEFQDSRALVNDFVLKKTVGAPLRFRPKTREELENELQALGKNFQRTVEKLRQDNQRNAEAKKEKHQSEADEDANEEKEVPVESNNIDTNALYEEIEQLRAELASKSVTIHAQADEMAELYADLDKLRVFEDQIVRKKHKIALLRDQLDRQQAENMELVQEKEDMAEKYLQLQEEAQFLRDINMEDAGAKDEERLEQLELIQTLRSRELELQDELEHQQKKWASDRDTVHQRLRLLEKEKKLAEEEVVRTNSEYASIQKKNGILHQEVHELGIVVQEEQDQKLLLASRIEELETKLVQLEALSQEERENNSRATAEKLSALESLVEEKTISVKKADRQLNAAKLLARQAKKEKENLLLRVAKLEADLAERTSSS